jgi:hypothetical protein
LITLEDEITDEEVVVSVFYERLPTFCLCCGVIGHREANYSLPESLKKKRYCPDLGVKATSVANPRSWYLPATTGQARRPINMALPWRVVAPLASRMEASPVPQRLAIISHVAQEVARLSVQDKEPEGEGNGHGKEKNQSSSASSIASKPHDTPQASLDNDQAIITNTDKIIDANPTNDKACLPAGNITVSLREEKEEEAQSKISPTAMAETIEEIHVTNLKSGGLALDINTPVLAHGKTANASEDQDATDREINQNVKSHSSVPSLSDGARVGDNALIRRLRAEANRGEEGV